MTYSQHQPVRIRRDGLLLVEGTLVSPVGAVSRAQLETNYRDFKQIVQLGCKQTVHEFSVVLHLLDTGELLADREVRNSMCRTGTPGTLTGQIELDGDVVRLEARTTGSDQDNWVFYAFGDDNNLPHLLDCSRR